MTCWQQIWALNECSFIHFDNQIYFNRWRWPWRPIIRPLNGSLVGFEIKILYALKKMSTITTLGFINLIISLVYFWIVTQPYKRHVKKIETNHHHKKIRQISLTENDYAGTPKPILIVHSNKLPPVVTRQIVAPGNMTPHE